VVKKSSTKDEDDGERLTTARLDDDQIRDSLPRCPLVIVLDWFPRRQIEDDDDHEHDQVISRRFSCRATF
jgi:hypothetical protein